MDWQLYISNKISNICKCESKLCKVDSLIIYHFISDCFTFGYLYVLWKNASPIVLDGFKKLVSTDHGGIRSENPEWEFYHQYFMQGKVEWLENIKRKVSFVKILRIKIDILYCQGHYCSLDTFVKAH